MMMSFLRKHFTRHDLLFYLCFTAIFFFIRSSVFASYLVPTGSMNPTILEGDFFFANKLAYRLKVPFTNRSIVRWASPERGDIVVFESPAKEGAKILTKRVIGLAGDVVEIKDKKLYINGSEVETRLVERKGGLSLLEEHLPDASYTIQHRSARCFLDEMRRMVVPAGHVFVMGDNRDNSADSRVWGCVPIDNVDGELFLRWFSVDPESYRPRFDRIRLL